MGNEWVLSDNPWKIIFIGCCVGRPSQIELISFLGDERLGVWTDIWGRLGNKTLVLSIRPELDESGTRLTITELRLGYCALGFAYIKHKLRSQAYRMWTLSLHFYLVISHGLQISTNATLIPVILDLRLIVLMVWIATLAAVNRALLVRNVTKVSYPTRCFLHSWSMWQCDYFDYWSSLNQAFHPQVDGSQKDSINYNHCLCRFC